MTEYRFDPSGLPVPKPDDSAYSVIELATEHRDLFWLETKQGSIVLRRMPVRMRAVINQSLMHLYPSRAKVVAELDSLMPFVRDVPKEDVDQEKLDRVLVLGDELAVTDATPLAVVVEPRLGSMEDWEELYSKLDREDRDRLERAVFEMARQRTPDEIDPTAEVIAERYGMHVIQEDMLPAETVSQRAYWVGRINAERELIDRRRTH